VPIDRDSGVLPVVSAVLLAIIRRGVKLLRKFCPQGLVKVGIAMYKPGKFPRSRHVEFGLLRAAEHVLPDNLE